jgi:hypothetical protein
MNTSTFLAGTTLQDPPDVKRVLLTRSSGVDVRRLPDPPTHFADRRVNAPVLLADALLVLCWAHQSSRSTVSTCMLA